MVYSYFRELARTPQKVRARRQWSPQCRYRVLKPSEWALYSGWDLAEAGSQRLACTNAQSHNLVLGGQSTGAARQAAQ